MSTSSTVEVALVEWGERLFYPANRIVKSSKTPRLTVRSAPTRQGASKGMLFTGGGCGSAWRNA